MIITLKDGSKKEYSEAKSVIDVAFDISEGLARAACAGEVDGEVVDLRTVLTSSHSIPCYGRSCSDTFPRGKGCNRTFY